MQMREKVGKSRNIVFFQWFVAPEGRKVGSLKRRVRSQLARWEIKKLHTVVARSTFRSQNVQNTTCSDHVWKLRCRKSARRCGAKHISKSKCTKHTRSGPLLAVEMWKKCTPLWREAHSKSKCTKHQGFGPLLEVQMSKKCTSLWREAHFEVNTLKTPGVPTTFGGSDVASRGKRKGLCTLSKVSKTWGFCSIFNYNHHYTTLHSNTLHYTTTRTTPSLHSTTLHSTTLHCTQLHSITLHYTTLHYTPLHYIALHYTAFHYTSLHYTTLHSTTLQLQLHNSTALNYTPLH